MITEFGKMLRKIRIDHDEYLKNMAERLGVTSSYLSAVENGKRNVTGKIIKGISETYDLNQETIKQLQKAAETSNQYVQLNLKNASIEQRNLAVAFARRFTNMDDEQIEKIKKILSKGE